MKKLSLLLVLAFPACGTTILGQKNPAVEVARIFVDGQARVAEAQAAGDAERTKALVEAIVAAVGSRPAASTDLQLPVMPVSSSPQIVTPPLVRVVLDPCSGVHPATLSQACVKVDPCAFPAAWSRECSDKAYREGRR